MSIGERDKYTGHMTTGHDWNGIKELNTRVPTILILFLTAAFLFSVAYWILMPAWPTVNSFTPGKLGIDQRNILDEQLQEAKALKTIWSDELLLDPIDDHLGNEKLMSIVAENGPALFKDNCAMCHGQQGQGALYFPSLSDDQWLWGGRPGDILKTLHVGINANVQGTRVAQMPAFGTTAILSSEEIEQLATYILSLSNPLIGSGKRVRETLAVNQGREIYSRQCVACHGVEGLGNTLLGAPNLSDAFWIYGGDLQSIKTTLKEGRAGYMPAWKERLSEVDLRQLALYVAQLADKTTAE
ncbi:MAG: cytochrome-c oxidase, cbb3-type subunit III [Granulosicoccus sp.]